ncbi:DUF2750 domain-containing protein [Glaciecola petra]|uniref:DUF2750 domain-containing protein n=1 Tax=Glaciecola petra TaxID=3075602 RepID=A0ABU2ZQY4_9ALTE|nr:DUF2750 domain-containing protein [Aestuariibacter sp. P117]MDT0595050.1 DUF2750 domain-containing protein [Aestuariibacter sp. P117]
MSDLKQIKRLPQEQRYQYLLKQVKLNKEVWILNDEHGCVMLNSEDEDCVPVWPSQAFAEEWATGDWEICQSKAIDLTTWRKRWTQGLIEDDLAIAVFPLVDDSEDVSSMVISADEFDFDLR